MASGPIQTQPAGLLGFLQLKNLGKNPAVLPDSLSCVLEMREWFFETNAVEETVASLNLITNGAAGNRNLFTVPQGEIWAIIDAVLTVNTAAGQTMAVQMQYRLANGRAFPMGGVLNQAAATSPGRLWGLGQGTDGASFERIRFVPPGGTVGVLVLPATVFNAADLAGFMSLKVVKLRM